MRNRFLILLSLLALSASVRLIVAHWVAKTPLVGDEWDYYARALRVLDGQPKGDGFRAPAFVYALAGFASIGARSPEALRMACAAVSSLVVLPVFLAGERLAGTCAGALAGVLAAIYLPLVAYSHYLWTEALYTVLGVVTLLLTTSALSRRRIGLSLVAGVCWAALMLTREVALAAFATVFATVAWKCNRDVWLRALVPLAIAATLPVVAWTVDLNSENRPGDAYAVVARTSYLNLYIGNGPVNEVKQRKPKLSARRHYESLARTPARREALAKPLVWRSIREKGLSWLPKKIETMVPKFFRPGGFPVRRMLIAEAQPQNPWRYRQRTGAPFPPNTSQALTNVFVSMVSLVLVLGTAGWLMLAGNSNTALFTAFSAFAVGHLWPTVIAFATTRFRLPTMPLFLVGTAYLLASRCGSWPRLSTRHRLLILSLTAAMSLLVWSELDRALTDAWQ